MFSVNPKQCVKKHDEWAEVYDKGNTTPYFKLLTDVLDTVIFAYLPKKGRILDAAGGTGRLSIPLAKKGYKVTCTDLSEKMLKQCEQKIRGQSFAKNISILKSDVTDMKEFKRNHFDFTICVGNCISYCNPDKALSELRRVTKKAAI